MIPRTPCEFCEKTFVNIDKHQALCFKNPNNKKTPVTTKGTAKFERPYYIWENGKKTHMVFIQNAIKQGKPLPIGFYEAAKNNPDRGIQKLYQVATTRKLKATVEMLDTRQ